MGKHFSRSQHASFAMCFHSITLNTKHLLIEISLILPADLASC